MISTRMDLTPPTHISATRAYGHLTPRGHRSDRFVDFLEGGGRAGRAGNELLTALVPLVVQDAKAEWVGKVIHANGTIQNKFVLPSGEMRFNPEKAHGGAALHRQRMQQTRCTSPHPLLLYL